MKEMRERERERKRERERIRYDKIKDRKESIDRKDWLTEMKIKDEEKNKWKNC